MKTRIAQSLLATLALALLLTSCEYREKQESRSSLALAAQAMEGNPQQAQQLLRSVSAELLNERDYAYYVLVQARVAGMNGVNIAPLGQAVAEAASYFSEKNEAPEAAFAYYVLAKVYEAQENPTSELHCYQLADDWASKASNQIPNFFYSAIPYNIALCYKINGHYKESLQYLKKALTCITTEQCNYTRKLYMLELKALDYKNLSEFSKALLYYGEALKIANQFKDTLSKNRILYNKYVLLYHSNDYELVEKNCTQLLDITRQSKDSLHLGLTYLALAHVYLKTNRIDSAASSIYKAKNLLTNVKNSMQLSLYETLSLVEQQKGNHANASKYQRQYDAYNAQLESKRKAEQAELAALSAERTREGERIAASLDGNEWTRFLYKDRVKKSWLIFGALLCCAMGLVWLKLLKSNIRKFLQGEGDTRNAAVAQLCKSEMLRWAERRGELREVVKNRRTPPSDEEVGRISYMIDDLVPPDDWNWRRLSPSIKCSYGELIGMLRVQFPQLGEKELELCAILYTQRLKARQVGDIVMLPPEQVREQRKVMKHKLLKAGYTAAKTRKYVSDLLKS